MEKILFEPDYIKKILLVSFTVNYKIKSSQDVAFLRKEWLKALSSWHSPYKAIIDCSNLEVLGSKDVLKSLTSLLKFLQALHLRKVCGFSLQIDQGHNFLPFDVFVDKKEAESSLGVRSLKEKKSDGNFRSAIQIDNHFKQGVMEVSFLHSVEIETKTQLLQLKKKLMNNLVLWHDSWSLLIDCSQLKINASLITLFADMIKLFEGFFLQKVIGYLPVDPKENYPFKTYRSRHKAFILLSTNTFDREVSNCHTRKK
jgi:hypothetical protein